MSIASVTPCASASWMLVVTSVRNGGLASRAARARAGMSDQAQVSGGSSHVYWKSRSRQPRASKNDDQRVASALCPMNSSVVDAAPESRVWAPPSS